MAQIRFSKKGSILLIIALMLVSFGIGFTTWKVTGLPNLSPTDSSAGNVGSCVLKSRADCAGSCVYNGAYDGDGEYCKWINNKCGNSGVACRDNETPPQLEIKIACSGTDKDIICTSFDSKCSTFCLNPVWANIGPRGCNAAESALGCAVGCTNDGVNDGRIEVGFEDCQDVPLSGTITCWGCSGKDSLGCRFANNNNPVDIGSSYYNATTDRIVCKDFCGAIQCDGANGYRDIVCDCDTPPLEPPKVCGDGVIDAGEVCDPPGSVSSACTEGDRICKSDCTCPTEANVCDGGGIVSQTTDYEVGDTITITGWAYDEDGVDSVIPVEVDGAVRGNATVANGCPTAASGCNANLANVVTWSYSFISTDATHSVDVEWQDTTGLTGANCNADQTITTQQVNPDWDMTKTAVGVCDETDPDNIFLPYQYTIVITNTSSVAGQLSDVVDTLDSNVDGLWIDLDSINPAATVSGNIITWNLTGDLAAFAAGESKSFTYTVNFPFESFSILEEYTNVVIATPTEGSSFSANETVIVSCDVPETGLFDTTKGRIITGFLLIVASLAYVYFDGVEMAVSNAFVGVGKLFGYESKVDRARKKFEKKW